MPASRSFRTFAALNEEAASAPRADMDRTNQLFVGNLPFTVDAQQLATLFADYSVTDTKIVYDQATGRSKGIAFVTFETSEEASKAQATVNGSVRRGVAGGLAFSGTRLTRLAGAERAQRARREPHAAGRAQAVRAARAARVRAPPAAGTSPLIPGGAASPPPPRPPPLTLRAAARCRSTTSASCSSATLRGRWTGWTWRTSSRSLAPSSLRRHAPAPVARRAARAARARSACRVERIAGRCPCLRASRSIPALFAQCRRRLFSALRSLSPQVINDRETGRSRGFGFVVMATKEESAAAASELSGANIDGRKIIVEFASEKAKTE